MDELITGFIGLDVHAESTAIGFAQADREAPRFVGTVGARLAELKKALGKLARCAQAGKPGASGGAGGRDEAIRDLSRARVDAVRARLKSGQQLKALMLRQGRRYTGKSSWTAAHQRYLAEVSFPHPAQHIAFEEYRQGVSEGETRVERLSQALAQEVEHWRMQAVVHAVMTLRGLDLVAATTVVAEFGDLRRFAHPRELMGYLGLVPSEHTSGSRRRLGAITKTGNTHVRRVLIEAAWNYRFPARISHTLQVRQQGQPQPIRAIAWRAQLRLSHRYRRLSARGLPHNKICVALARELAGLIWDIARHVSPSP